MQRMNSYVAFFAVLIITVSNYGAGFIGSPSGLANTQSAASSANYGGGFISAPNFTSASLYMPFAYRATGNYGGGFVQSPPVWYGYHSRLTFW